MERFINSLGLNLAQIYNLKQSKASHLIYSETIISILYKKNTLCCTMALLEIKLGYKCS